jgi:hypothetical protein
MLKRINWTHSFDFLLLSSAWPELVGPLLSQNTVPLKMKNKTLFILTKHMAFAQELNYLAKELILKIESKFPILKGVITQIAFETNEGFFNLKKEIELKSSAPSPFHPQSPKYRLALEEAKKFFSHLEENEEKEKWLSLYIQMKLNTNN